VFEQFYRFEEPENAPGQAVTAPSALAHQTADDVRPRGLHQR